MPWERRGKASYYTRTRRVNGRRVHQYVGRGPEAELAAALDARLRREREALWLAVKEERARWANGPTPLNVLIELAELLLRTALLTAGYHQHRKGSWRKRHDHRH